MRTDLGSHLRRKRGGITNDANPWLCRRQNISIQTKVAVLGNLVAQFVGDLLPSPAIAQGDGHGPLGIVLADDEFVELGDDLSWGQILQAEVARLMSGRRIRDGLTFFVHTNEHIFSAAENDGLIETLGASGVQVTADNCAVVSYDRLPSDACLATNSAKMAFLASAVSGVDILYGGVADCVEAAISGRWRDTPA